MESDLIRHEENEGKNVESELAQERLETNEAEVVSNIQDGQIREITDLGEEPEHVVEKAPEEVLSSDANPFGEINMEQLVTNRSLNQHSPGRFSSVNRNNSRLLSNTGDTSVVRMSDVPFKNYHYRNGIRIEGLQPELNGGVIRSVVNVSHYDTISQVHASGVHGNRSFLSPARSSVNRIHQSTIRSPSRGSVSRIHQSTIRSPSRGSVSRIHQSTLHTPARSIVNRNHQSTIRSPSRGSVSRIHQSSIRSPSKGSVSRVIRHPSKEISNRITSQNSRVVSNYGTSCIPNTRSTIRNDNYVSRESNYLSPTYYSRAPSREVTPVRRVGNTIGTSNVFSRHGSKYSGINNVPSTQGSTYRPSNAHLQVPGNVTTNYSRSNASYLRPSTQNSSFLGSNLPHSKENPLKTKLIQSRFN